MAKASGEGMKDLIQQKKDQASQALSVKKLLSQDAFKKRFEDILGDRAPGFMASVINATNMNKALAACDPYSVISSAAVAATLDLPVDKNLGFAHIVPYSGEAQFQMGWKGYVQLALRTSYYKRMNVSEVYEDELASYNPITEEIEFTPMDTWRHRDEGLTNKICGYYAYFELLNGFKKELFMTVKQVDNHAKTYSKSYSNPRGQWKQNFHAMALKTVIKRLLNKWGIMSIEMQTAIKTDQGVVRDMDDLDSVYYPDGGEAEEYIDAEAVEVESEPEPKSEPKDKGEPKGPQDKKGSAQGQQKKTGTQKSQQTIMSDDVPGFAK